MIFSVTRFFHCFRYTLILTRGCPESRCGESRWKWFLEDFSDFSEFSRKFALKNSEKVYEVGVRFSLEIRKRGWKWFQTPRRLYSVEVPRELCGFCMFSRVFNSTFCVSFMRFYANFEFQKCAGTSSSFRPYRRVFFNAPAKSSRSGRAKFLMNFIENHWFLRVWGEFFD